MLWVLVLVVEVSLIFFLLKKKSRLSGVSLKQKDYLFLSTSPNQEVNLGGGASANTVSTVVIRLTGSPESHHQRKTTANQYSDKATVIAAPESLKPRDFP